RLAALTRPVLSDLPSRRPHAPSQPVSVQTCPLPTASSHSLPNIAANITAASRPDLPSLIRRAWSPRAPSCHELLIIATASRENRSEERRVGNEHRSTCSADYCSRLAARPSPACAYSV